MNKRIFSIGLLSGAGALGLGYSFFRQNPSQGLNAFWSLKLDLPQGGTIELKSLHGVPSVINFWASWCPPCVEELPLLEDFFRLNKAKNWQVMGIAVDTPAAVTKFLTQMPLSFPTPIAGLGGVELSKTLGNLSGGLPFTVVINARGEIVLRHMGRLSAEQIQNFVSII
jgi:thiol-disulfide isomerase/thioredoxin